MDNLSNISTVTRVFREMNQYIICIAIMRIKNLISYSPVWTDPIVGSKTIYHKRDRIARIVAAKCLQSAIEISHSTSTIEIAPPRSSGVVVTAKSPILKQISGDHTSSANGFSGTVEHTVFMSVSRYRRNRLAWRIVPRTQRK